MSDLHNHSPDDEQLSRSLRRARGNLVLQERIRQLQTQLQADWENHRSAVNSDQPTGLSPVQALHTEALACIAALSDFHCCVAHSLIAQGEHEGAHSWAIDEGTLSAAFDLINSVDVDDC